MELSHTEQHRRRLSLIILVKLSSILVTRVPLFLPRLPKFQCWFFLSVPGDYDRSYELHKKRLVETSDRAKRLYRQSWMKAKNSGREAMAEIEFDERIGRLTERQDEVWRLMDELKKDFLRLETAVCASPAPPFEPIRKGFEVGFGNSLDDEGTV